MKLLGVLVAVSVLASCAMCDIPNVFEFCSALLSDRRTTCDRTTCQGSPGKKGIPGQRGPPGVKGDKGADEHFDALLIEFGRLKDAVNILLKETPLENRIDLCAMGMKSGEIPDSAISVSSSHSGYNGKYARLDRQKESGKVYAGWHVKWNRRDESGHWIQVDLGSTKSVSGLITQGRPDNSQWTTSYKVACGLSVASLQTLTENGQEKVFPGNRDQNTKVVNMFPSPVTCRYIRIYPQTWNIVSVLRLEFLRGDCIYVFAK